MLFKGQLYLSHRGNIKIKLVMCVKQLATYLEYDTLPQMLIIVLFFLKVNWIV